MTCGRVFTDTLLLLVMRVKCCLSDFFWRFAYFTHLFPPVSTTVIALSVLFPLSAQDHLSIITGTLPLPHPSECTPVEMRGPPPAWMPPHPPDRDHDYENNYEDPEDIRERGRREEIAETWRRAIQAVQKGYNGFHTWRTVALMCVGGEGFCYGMSQTPVVVLLELSSRDLLLTTATTAPPPKYNSYEMSLSQQVCAFSSCFQFF